MNRVVDWATKAATAGKRVGQAVGKAATATKQAVGNKMTAGKRVGQAVGKAINKNRNK